MIKNSTFIDCESLSHCDGNNYNTSNCKESNAGYQVSGVGLIITSSMVVFIDTKFMGSCESIYAYKCSINFIGNNRFVEINNEQSKAPSALFVIQSKVSINEECTFMHNAAVSGGAIHAVESTIDINFNSTLVVANNNASDSGGGVYLYRSDFNCKIGSAIKIIDNIAAIKGGGIHAISSAIKVTYTRHSYFERSLLLFERNTANKGGGVSLEANAKLLVLKEGTNKDKLNHNSSIFFRDNEAKECGGAVYVADESNAATCDGDGDISSRHSDATECFIQVLAVLLMESVHDNNNLISVEFSNNSAPSGGLLFGGLLDRCTPSQIAETKKATGNNKSSNLR